MGISQQPQTQRVMVLYTGLALFFYRLLQVMGHTPCIDDKSLSSSTGQYLKNFDLKGFGADVETQLSN